MTSPLPESNFRWRRIYSYVLTVALLVALGVIIWQLAEAAALEQLADLAFWLIILLWWVVTYYMIAPSAEQIARIIQSARVAMFGAKDGE